MAMFLSFLLTLTGFAFSGGLHTATHYQAGSVRPMDTVAPIIPFAMSVPNPHP